MFKSPIGPILARVPPVQLKDWEQLMKLKVALARKTHSMQLNNTSASLPLRLHRPWRQRPRNHQTERRTVDNRRLLPHHQDRLRGKTRLSKKRRPHHRTLPYLLPRANPLQVSRKESQPCRETLQPRRNHRYAARYELPQHRRRRIHSHLHQNRSDQQSPRLCRLQNRHADSLKAENEKNHHWDKKIFVQGQRGVKIATKLWNQRSPKSLLQRSGALISQNRSVKLEMSAKYIGK